MLSIILIVMDEVVQLLHTIKFHLHSRIKFNELLLCQRTFSLGFKLNLSELRAASFSPDFDDQLKT